MMDRKNIVLASVWMLVVSLPIGFLRADDKSAASDTKSPDAAATAPAKAKNELSPEMTALRDLVRQTLAAHQKSAPNTQSNSPTEVLSYCLAYGCNTQMRLNNSDDQRINGITCLCYNYPCAGYEMLGYSQKHIAPRIGYGYQERPGEFLAMLAMSRVKPDYPVRIGKDTRTVADVIEAEKLGCRLNTDQSLKLIGLSYYVDEPEWKNDLRDTWTIERLIQEELAQPVVTAPEGGLNRLLGLSYAVDRREKRNEPIDGQYARAKKYISDFQDFAFQLQNTDGSWGPQFLAARSDNRDLASQLRSTGRILEWLTLSLPNDKLNDARVAKAVENVARLLSSQQYQWRVPSLSTREIVSAGHALHALNMYDQRVFQPMDTPAEKPAAEKAAPETANRDTTAAPSR